MTFLSPLMLIALAAISVPIIIHLIHRRRARPRSFSAVEFVLRSRRAVQKKFRLKQLILLILRCLALAAFALALARPLAGALAARSTSVEGPAAVVILVDTSMSMQATHSGRPAFDIAREKANELINGLAPESEAAIIAFDDRVRDLTSGLTADRNRLSDALERLDVTYRPTDVNGALDAASALLARSEQPRKFAIVLTDLAATGWNGVRPRAQESEVFWRVIDVTTTGDTDNAAAVALGLREDPGAGLAVTLTTASFAAEKIDSLTGELIVDGRSAGKGFVELEPGATAEKRFTIPPPGPGVHRAAAQVAADSLAADDVRYLVFRGRARLRALIVDGDPTTVPRDAESFYLERALLPSRGLAGDLAPTVVDTEGLHRSDLSRYDVVILANTSDFSSAAAARLREFVNNGGGLMVGLGDRVEARQLQSLIGDLLPASIRGFREAQPGASAAASGPLSIRSFPSEHPVLQVFNAETLHVFEETKFTKAAILQNVKKDATVLLKFSDETPALVEHGVGRGKVILFASSFDRGWNDLPIATVFLPLIRRTVRYLGGDLEASGAGEARVGNAFSINVGETHQTIRVVGPTEDDITEVGVVDGIAELTPEAPGFYRLLTGSGTEDPLLERRSFAANVDPMESDLRRLDAEKLEELFGDRLEVAGGGGNRSRGSGNKPYWGALLILAVASLTTEGVLTRG